MAKRMSSGTEEYNVNLLFGKRSESGRFQILNALINIVVVVVVVVVVVKVKFTLNRPGRPRGGVEV